MMDPKDPSAGQKDKSDSPNDSQPSNEPQSVPTIITYPEFLLRRPPRPPPLLTPSRVLDTLYVAGGIMATMYGTSKYVIMPMMEALSEARLSLAGVALAHLKNLNSRLERTVSEIPVSAMVEKQQSSSAVARSVDELHAGGHDVLLRSETSSVSDPTELFHVDVGTQTSPVISRPTSPPNGRRFPSTAEDRLARLAHQESRLKDLRAHLLDTVEDVNDLGDADAVVAESIQELSTYLDSLVDTSPYYGSNNHMYGGGLLGASGVQNRGQSNTISDDEVMGVKAEIRGIKGVLLNARNFPALGDRTGGKIAGMN